ncbi:prepilin-type N-terminal cleavage/methylation domain-containing protein [bacterium]|nr:prepilin-type N-terminal cleavage/methylation domain-containing protein [bacterium]
MSNNKGFTLIEIIVAVALVAILSAAIAPSVLNNIAQGRIARTQSDVQALGSAVMRFKSDTGKFPRLAAAAKADTAGNSVDFLASSIGTFPQTGGNNLWSGGSLTNGVTTTGSCEDFAHHLIMGISRATTSDSLYVRAANIEDPNSFGFRSGLISADQADPWGHKYMSNVKALGVTGQAVWVISAGPNGVMETAVNDTGCYAASAVGGDDIGFRLQ